MALPEPDHSDEPPELKKTFSYEDLQQMFASDEKVNSMREWIRNNVLKKVNWRQNYVHLRLYTFKNYQAGILGKIEAVKPSISNANMELLIDLLYTLGYGILRITFILWTYGYRTNRNAVDSYIRSNKFKLNRLREEMITTINNAKHQLFQEMGSETMAAERRTCEILLQKIKSLQDALISIDPVEEGARYSRLTKYLKEAQEMINKMHGTELWREASIEANREIITAKEIFKARKEIDDGPPLLPPAPDTSLPGKVVDFGD